MPSTNGLLHLLVAALGMTVACRADTPRSHPIQQVASTPAMVPSDSDSTVALFGPGPPPPLIPHGDENPWIENADSGPTIHLPPAMARALARTFPHFHLWPWAAYPERIRALYRGGDRDGIRAVVGDFNADGRWDIVMDGADSSVFPSGKTEARLSIIALLTSGDSAIAMPVAGGGSMLPGDSLGAPRPRWLVLVPARTYRAALDKDAVGVPHILNPGNLVPGQVFFWSPDRPYFMQWSDGE